MATFGVCDLGDKEVIIGHTWLSFHNPEINWRTGEVIFKQVSQQVSPVEEVRRSTREDIRRGSQASCLFWLKMIMKRKMRLCQSKNGRRTTECWSHFCIPLLPSMPAAQSPQTWQQDRRKTGRRSPLRTLFLSSTMTSRRSSPRSHLMNCLKGSLGIMPLNSSQEHSHSVPRSIHYHHWSRLN